MRGQRRRFALVAEGCGETREIHFRGRVAERYLSSPSTLSCVYVCGSAAPSVEARAICAPGQKEVSSMTTFQFAETSTATPPGRTITHHLSISEKHMEKHHMSCQSVKQIAMRAMPRLARSGLRIHYCK
jgi:hypothetical protein